MARARPLQGLCLVIGGRLQSRPLRSSQAGLTPISIGSDFRQTGELGRPPLSEFCRQPDAPACARYQVNNTPQKTNQANSGIQNSLRKTNIYGQALAMETGGGLEAKWLPQ